MCGVLSVLFSPLIATSSADVCLDRPVGGCFVITISWFLKMGPGSARRLGGPPRVRGDGRGKRWGPYPKTWIYPMRPVNWEGSRRMRPETGAGMSGTGKLRPGSLGRASAITRLKTTHRCHCEERYARRRNPGPLAQSKGLWIAALAAQARDDVTRQEDIPHEP